MPTNVFYDFAEEHFYRQVTDFSQPNTHDTVWCIFSPYTTTHDTTRSVRMRDRHFHEARVDPGAIPPVKVYNGDYVPDTKNARESTMPFAQTNGLLQVWDMPRAIVIAKALHLRFLILLYETMHIPHYHDVKDNPPISTLINELIMPELKKHIFFCIIEVNPSPIIFICNQFALRRLWSSGQPMPHNQLSSCWITHIATVTRWNLFLDPYNWSGASSFAEDKRNIIIIIIITSVFEQISEKINSAESWKTYRRWRANKKRIHECR